MTREAFEAWVSDPPFEYSIERMTELSSWPGNYRGIEVQLAWEAWQAAVADEREACALICDTHTVDDALVGVGISQSCAAMIRARSNAEITGG